MPVPPSLHNRTFNTPTMRLSGVFCVISFCLAGARAQQDLVARLPDCAVCLLLLSPYVGIPLIWFIGSMPVCSLTDDQLLAERCSLSLRR
jgi:hypothetical protein